MKILSLSATVAMAIACATPCLAAPSGSVLLDTRPTAQHAIAPARPTTSYLHRAQYGRAWRAVNNYGAEFWSQRSAEHAVYVCRINTPYYGRCWYRGYW